MCLPTYLKMQGQKARGDNMICHYITKYEEGGQWYVESWIQINIFGKCICLFKRKIKTER